MVDFGCGKAYLTFAVHDYLSNVLQREARVTGVELREDLVDFCQRAVQRLGLDGLTFEQGDVRTHAPGPVDVMIALHACDTATDHRDPPRHPRGRERDHVFTLLPQAAAPADAQPARCCSRCCSTASTSGRRRRW